MLAVKAKSVKVEFANKAAEMTMLVTMIKHALTASAKVKAINCSAF